MEMDLITCKECNIHKSITKFYRIIKEKLIDNEYQPFVICKDCIKKEYLSEYEKVNNNFRQALIIMCTKYNIYYDENLMQSSKDNNIEDGWNLFQQYIKYISSLPQYNGLKYKDSVWENKNIHTKTGMSEEIIIKEKSDIDFINDDIKGVKGHIEYSLRQHNVNEHNKWLNSLRDAFLLRERIESIIKPTYDLYFDVGRAESETNCTIYYKGQVHSLRKFNSSYISEYINKLCEDDNVAIYGDINGLGRVIADSLYSLGYKINDTTINFKDSSIKGGETRKLECKYDR